MKRYFREEDDEHCYPLSYFRQLMKDEGLTELKLIEAKRDSGGDAFWCKEHDAVGLKGDDYLPCGSDCKEYAPRNGKSGCCKHYRSTYHPSDTELILKSPAPVKEKSSMSLTGKTKKFYKTIKERLEMLEQAKKEMNFLGYDLNPIGCPGKDMKQAMTENSLKQIELIKSILNKIKKSIQDNQ